MEKNSAALENSGKISVSETSKASKLAKDKMSSGKSNEINSDTPSNPPQVMKKPSKQSESDKLEAALKKPQLKKKKTLDAIEQNKNLSPVPSQQTFQYYQPNQNLRHAFKILK